MIIVICVIIIVILLILWPRTKHRVDWREDTAAIDLADDLKIAEEYVKMSTKPRKTAYEELTLGRVMRHRGNNPVAARQHYAAAVRKIAEERPQNARPILFQIAEEDVVDRGLQRAILSSFAVTTTQTAAQRETGTQGPAAAIVQLQTHGNDSQNSHDTAVNISLRRIIENLQAAVGEAADGAGAAAEIAGLKLPDISDTQKTRALETLQRIKKNDFVSSYNMRAMDVLALVWGRARGSPKLQELVILALADASIAGGGTVCINGILSRLLAVFDGVDEEIAPAPIVTAEMHRNIVLNKAAMLVRREIDTAAEPVRAYYDGKTTEETDEIAAFKREVRKKIDDIIDAYDPPFTATAAELIRRDCYIAID